MTVIVTAHGCCASDCVMDAIREVLLTETCIPSFIVALSDFQLSPFSYTSDDDYFRVEATFTTSAGLDIKLPVRYADMSDMSNSEGCEEHADILLKQWCLFFNTGSYSDDGYSYKN